MRTKAGTAVLAAAVALGVLAMPSTAGAETVPLLGLTPTAIDLPGRVLRIAVDPGDGRLFLVMPGVLQVRDVEGELLTSLDLPNLADVALSDGELYLLTRTSLGGQLIRRDAGTLAVISTWDWQAGPDWTADLASRTHLTVSEGRAWWADAEPQWGCGFFEHLCDRQIRINGPGGAAGLAEFAPIIDLMPSGGGVLAASSGSLRRIAPTAWWTPWTTTGMTGTTDIARSSDGERIVAVQQWALEGTAPELSSADFAPTGTTFTADRSAAAVEIAANGTVALAGGSLALFRPGGGDPTSSYDLGAASWYAVPDLTRFSPDGSKVYVVASKQVTGSADLQRLFVADVATPDLGPFADVPAFVTQQYADALGRPATAQEQEAALAALASGGRPGSVIAPLVQAEAAAEPARASIIRLYQAAFLRPPDRSGLEFWLRRYGAGTKLTDVAANFAGSAEFQRRYGTLGNAAFVQLIFQNVFGRAVDPSGLAYWTGRLDAGRSRGVALAQWSESSEYVRKMAGLVDVTALYLVMLDRMPTAQEFADAKAALAGGTTLVDGADGMLHAAAYAARIG